MTKYLTIVHKEIDGDYGISFPDFLGCISCGETLEECYRMGKEALEIHITSMIKDGDEIPRPMLKENISKDLIDLDSLFEIGYMSIDVNELRADVALSVLINDRKEYERVKINFNEL